MSYWIEFWIKVEKNGRKRGEWLSFEMDLEFEENADGNRNLWLKLEWIVWPSKYTFWVKKINFESPKWRPPNKTSILETQNSILNSKKYI